MFYFQLPMFVSVQHKQLLLCNLYATKNQEFLYYNGWFV